MHIINSIFLLAFVRYFVLVCLRVCAFMTFRSVRFCFCKNLPAFSRSLIISFVCSICGSLHGLPKQSKPPSNIQGIVVEYVSTYARRKVRMMIRWKCVCVWSIQLNHSNSRSLLKYAMGGSFAHPFSSRCTQCMSGCILCIYLYFRLELWRLSLISLSLSMP